MNGREDWGRSGRGRSGRGRSPGVDPLLDKALRLTRELFAVLQRAERQTDDAAQDLRRSVAVEREALHDLTGRGRSGRGRSGRGRSARGRSGRRVGDWRGR